MEYVYIGKIVNTHGIKGELRIKSNFLEKDKVFKPGFNLYLSNSHIKEEIVTYRVHKDYDMVTFKGYDNINQVLDFLKMDVYASLDDIKLKEGEYIVSELVGYEVYNKDVKVGIVRDIVYNGSNILLEISADKDFYIPNNPNFIKNVDISNKRIDVLNIEGLIL